MNTTKKLIVIFIVLIAAVVAGIFLYDRLSRTSFSAEVEDFTLDAKFTGGDSWEYTITGSVPNPCYEESIEVTTSDDVTTIDLQLTGPDQDEICAQVIEDLELTGEFTAPRDQEFLFKVTKLQADGSMSNGLEDLQALNTTVSSSGNFQVISQYFGENNWKYTLTGTLPTECHDFTVEELIAESFPEQVTINVSVVEEGENCAQVIQEVSYEGEYQASEQATLKLELF